jgi:hypothetical protein
VRGTSHPARSNRKSMSPSGPVTSCGHGHRRCRSVVRILGRLVGTCGAHHGGCGCRHCHSCRHWRLDGEPRWCSGVTVRPKMFLDRQPFGSVPVAPMPRGGGFWRCAEGATLPSCTDCWHDAELSACCAAAVSRRALSCCCTLHSSGVAASGQPRSSITVTARFCDALLKSGGASLSTFAPSLARRLLSRARP